MCEIVILRDGRELETQGQLAEWLRAPVKHLPRKGHYAGTNREKDCLCPIQMSRIFGIEIDELGYWREVEDSSNAQ